MTHGQEETLDAYGTHVIPQFTRSDRIGVRQENIEAWRSVAAGWERQRELIWSSTRPVSERLVELLAPMPGESILELAAGPGDTGFLAHSQLRPGGRLLSTDVAPEMVDTARRRAAELGVDGVSFAVEDAASLTLEDASSTASSAAGG